MEASSQAAGPAVEVVQDDLDRILALPRRPPLECSYDEEAKLYRSPKTEALVRVMTKRFGRGERLSCACRPRVVRSLGGGKLLVERVIPAFLREEEREEDEEAGQPQPPQPPKLITVDDFVRDSSANSDEIETAVRVADLRAGQVLRLPAADPSLGGDGHVCLDKLNAFQSWTLREVPVEGAGMLWGGVGSGKSLVFLLLPIAFGAECEGAVLLIESNQRMHYVSQYLRAREHFRVPSVVFDDGSRPYLVPTGGPTLNLLSYAKLGNPKYPSELDSIGGNVFGADEAHRLTGEVMTTGRTRLFSHFAKKIKERERRIAEGLPVKRRAVFFVPGSGTFEDKSVLDTVKVSRYALGTGSPTPVDLAEARRWVPVFDPVRMVDRESRTARRLQVAFGGGIWQGGQGSIAQALADFGGGPEKAIREGFRKWRRETPGVISAAATEVGASLYFKERKAPPMPTCIQAALKKVREEGIRPDGESIVGPDGESIVGDDENSAAAATKIIAKQVGGGFHYYWAYPKVPCTCGGESPRCAGCLLIDKWFTCKKRYHKELRSVRLLEPLVHLDSPKLCKNAAIRAAEDASPPFGLDVYCVDCRGVWPCGKATHLPAWRSTHFAAWHAIEDKVPHEQRVRWVCRHPGEEHDPPEAADPKTHPGYYLARDTVKYTEENLGVVWCQSVAYGRKVAELAGLPYHGGGTDGESELRSENGKRSVICSLKSWGKGFDGLQHHFHKQHFPEFPSSNRIVEQVLGRLRRRGQRMDSIFSEYYAHIAELREALRRVLQRAEFNQSMTAPALILSADFE